MCLSKRLIHCKSNQDQCLKIVTRPDTAQLVFQWVCGSPDRDSPLEPTARPPEQHLGLGAPTNDRTEI